MGNVQVPKSYQLSTTKKSNPSRPLSLQDFLKEMDELPRARLSKKVEDGLVSLPNGKRLDRVVYMSKSEIEAHLSLFNDGVVKIQSKEWRIG